MDISRIEELLAEITADARSIKRILEDIANFDHDPYKIHAGIVVADHLLDMANEAEEIVTKLEKNPKNEA